MCDVRDLLVHVVCLQAKSLASSLSTRQLLKICRRLSQYPEESIAHAVNKACLSRSTHKHIQIPCFCVFIFVVLHYMDEKASYVRFLELYDCTSDKVCDCVFQVSAQFGPCLS